MLGQIFRSTTVSHFGEQFSLTHINIFVLFFKYNFIILRQFENFFISSPKIKYISYQEMLIIRRLHQAKCIASNLFELCHGEQRRTIIYNKVEFNLTNENERVG